MTPIQSQSPNYPSPSEKSNQPNTDELVKKLKKLSSKNLEVEKDLFILDSKVNKLNNLLTASVNNSLSNLYLGGALSIKNIKEVGDYLKGIIEKVNKCQENSIKSTELKKKIITELNKDVKLVEQVINYEKRYVNPFSSQRDHEFYLAYSNFIKAKNELQGTMFKESLNCDECVKNPSSHPEWPIFKNEMQKYISDEAKIEHMWELTFKGIDYQLNLNDTGKKNDPNPYFDELAASLSHEGLLSVNPGESFALWSGGFDLSLYVQSQGFTTLGKTKAGKIFDVLMLFSNMKPLGPLWDSLSKEFAKNCEDSAHVFFRVQDPFSVLERKEIKEILKSERVKKVVFHPIINKGYSVDALDVQELQVVKGENPQNFLKIALVKVIQGALKHDEESANVYKANLTAIKKMKLD